MSFIRIPDRNPGRCINLRPHRDPYGAMRRCLEAEGTQHYCRFEPERSTPATRGSSSTSSYALSSRPEPWVVPPVEPT